MDPITTYLVSMGVNIASSLIYDKIKTTLSKGTTSHDELKDQIASCLNVENAYAYAEHIINILAQNGNITITGSLISANDEINMFSSKNTELSFGDGSVSQTKNTKIIAGKGAKIISKGGAGIRQNDDGSIGFYA